MSALSLSVAFSVYVSQCVSLDVSLEAGQRVNASRDARRIYGMKQEQLYYGYIRYSDMSSPAACLSRISVEDMSIMGASIISI